MDLASINVKFGANTSGFTSGLGSMQSAMRGFSASAPMLLAGVGIAIAALAVKMGVDAVKAAADFQQGLNRLITGAGDTTDNMQKMGLAIRGISQDTGVLTGELLPAMYQIISANQRGAQAEDTLRVAAMGSIVEQAKIVDVAKAITTVMTDFSNKHYTATQAMNGLTRATQLGKLTLEQLSTALSPILSTAANLGIHFSDLAAAMSTMTNAGVPAERAATSLRFLMQSLENPTKKATTAMQAMGLNTVAVGEEMKKSLPGALEMIYKAALKAGPEGSVPFNRAMSDMIGGQRSLQAMLSLTGTHFATFTDDAAKIAAAMGIGVTAVLGWDVAQKNFNVQLDRGKAAFQGLLITIGNMLLPVLTQLLTQVTPIIQSFTDWLSNSDNLQAGLDTLTSIMAPLISAIQDTWTYLQPLIQQVIAWAIKNDVLGKTIAVVSAYVQLMAAWLRFIVPVIVSVIQAVIQFVSALWDRLGPAILTIVAFIQTHWSQIATIFQGVWDIITAAVKVAWSVLSGIILVGIDILQGPWGKAWDDIKATFATVWEGIKQAAIGAVKIFLGVIALLPGAVGDAARAALKWLDSLNTSAKKSALDTQKAVVANIQAMITSLQTQLDNATSASQRAFIKMKLDAAQESLAMQQQVLQNMQGLTDGVVTQSTNMANKSTAEVKRMHQQIINHLINMNDEAVGHSIIPNMVNSIISWFAKLPGGVMNAISSLSGRLSGFFNGLASQAFSWGLHIIQNLAAGITAGFNAAVAAAQAIADAVKRILGHSKPTEGPLKDDDVWGAHLVDNFVKGILAGAPRVQSALAQMLGSAGIPGGGLNLGISGSFSGPSGIASSFGGGSPVIHVHVHNEGAPIYIDGHEMVQRLGPHLAYDVAVQNAWRKPV